MVFKRWGISVLVPLAAMTFYYLSFAVAGLDYIRVHDILDGHITENILIAEFWTQSQHPSGGQPLGGTVPVYALGRLLQPLTIIPYSTLSPLVAYLLVDAIVRGVAFLTFKWLAKDFGARDGLAVFLALAVSVSVSFTVYGFGIVGLGVAMLAFRANSQVRAASVGSNLALLLVAMNTSLPIHGAFVLVSIPLVLVVAYGTSNWRRNAYITCVYLVGLLLGNLGILYSLGFSGISWHRESFLETLDLNETSKAIFSSSGALFPIVDSLYYHTFFPVSLIALGILGSSFFSTSQKKWWSRQSNALVAAAYAIFAITPLVKYVLLAVAPHMVTINLERLTILGLSCVLLALLSESRASGNLPRAILASSLVLQIIFASLFTPHLRAAVLAIAPSMPLTHIGMSFDQLDQVPFSKAKELVGREMVLAIGIPSFRLNLVGIDTLGGYSSLYPQSHKTIYGQVIAGTLVDDALRDYFWNWGSRAELDQISESQYCAVDFFSARDAGVSFIASKAPLSCATGLPLMESGELFLYSIDSFT